MAKEVKIRQSELKKVPGYTKDLQGVAVRSKEVGHEEALVEWAARITERRLAWLEKNKDCLTRLQGTEVRKGFELIMVEYMGVPLEEMTIIEETGTKITWRSHDFCPYFEAIKALGMDTRIVCKYATEAPVQALLSVLNPHLRFSRNYQSIRPHTDYCEETIELVK